jgi:hypothetical protein
VPKSSLASAQARLYQQQQHQPAPEQQWQQHNHQPSILTGQWQQQ